LFKLKSQMRLKSLFVVTAALTLGPLASAGPTPKGWVTKGPKENRERVHRATGLSCSTELLPEMGLTDFGAARTVAPGRPFCAFERSGDTVRIYVLGRSAPSPTSLAALSGAARAENQTGRNLPVFQTIDVVAKDSGTPWTGVAFDLSNGTSQTPRVASISFASINGWDVRLDIDYQIADAGDPGPKSQEAELRDAMSYLLAATLKKNK
jgi:hypothetical protein